MIRKKNLGRNIFPDFDNTDLDLIKTVLSEYHLDMDFLFEDGVEFTWDDDIITAKDYPSDISFYKTSASGVTELMLTYVESWGELLFEDPFGNTILSIIIQEDEPEFFKQL